MDFLKTVELDLDKGIFRVNGIDMHKVDYFDLCFENGSITLIFRNEYFADGVKLSRNEFGCSIK